MAKPTDTSEIGDDDRLDRRQLVTGSLGLFGILQLCCTTPEIARQSLTYGDGVLVVDLKKAPELRSAGSAAAVVDASRKLDIIIAHAGRNRFVALDRSCTHNGAQCTYNHKRQTIQCTSLNHAEYDIEGTLLHGRTHGNLRCYETRLAGARLEILIARKDA